MRNGRFSRIAAVFFIAMSALLAASPVFAIPRLPNDPYVAEQTYLKTINAYEAWNYSLGFEGVPIAIIDSGVDIAHPDLKDNIWTNTKEIFGNGIDDDLNGYVDDVHGWDFVGNDNDPSPDLTGAYETLPANHGTIVAGIAAARGDNGAGIAGVTWQSAIMPLRVLNDSGVGDPDSVVAAVEYAAHNGAKVINLSFVGSTENPLLRIAVKNAYDAGVLVVAAAGNAPSGENAVNLDRKPLFPVCFDQDVADDYIFGVGATDVADQKAPFSNYGSKCVDIAAPGTHVISTQLFRPERDAFHEAYGGFFNGTSVAAPIVSGVAAMLFALDRNLTPKQVMQAMASSAASIKDIDPDYGPKLGDGRVDALGAVLAVLHRATSANAAPIIPTDKLLPSGSQGVIIAAPGPGRAPELRMFTTDGLFIRGWDAFPGDFTGGVSLDIGAFDPNEKSSIIVGAMAGGSPHIRIFNRDTKPIGGFFAFDKNFKGGVTVAAGDVDGDGKDEIIAGAGKGIASVIRLFSPQGKVLREIRPFGAVRRTGTDVTAFDIDDDGKDDIVVAARGTNAFYAFGGGGDAKGLVDGRLRRESAAHTTFAAASANPLRFVLGSAFGAAPRIRSVNRAGGDPLQFDAYERGFKGGVTARILE